MLRHRQDEPVTQESARVSEREAEVLAALGEHLSNAQIASRLHLSVRTVETHVSSLLRKLGADDRRQLAVLAPSVAELGDAADGPGAVRGLPNTWTPFIGRSRERAEILDALDSERLVTVLGPGGAGKTRLATEVARDLATSLPLGATFVELVSTRPGFFVPTVAAVLGVSEQPGRSLLEAVIDRLRPGRSLLVLDNCEHLIDDAAEFLSALLGAAPDVLVLATSRERIGVAGERVVPLGGLSTIATETGGAAGSEAVALFVDRATTLDAQFAADPSVIGDLCAQLDGMPLAIELAAARSAALGIGGLQTGLADRLRLLSGGRSGDVRHRSLRAVLDWSHELLDDDERVALRRLGRFAGAVDLVAAGAVTALPPAAIADLVGRLADKSLLVHQPGDNRWALLETVRAYALEHLETAGELDAVTTRYLAWAVESAAAIEADLERGGAWRPAFDASAADLRAGLALADGEIAARLARSLGHLAYARRFLGEARRHYLLAAEVTTDDAQAAHDLQNAAGVAQVETRGQLRHEYALAAADRAGAAGDSATQAAVLAEAVSVATRFPALFPDDVGLDELNRLISVAGEVAPNGDPLVRAQLVAADAWTATRVVEVPDTATFEQALQLAEQVNDPLLISAALDALGTAQVMAGRMRSAHELNNRRLALLTRLPNHEPRAGSEIHDICHMAVENAVSAGEPTVALAAALDIADNDRVAAAPEMLASKPVVPLMLLGRFDEALTWAGRAREAWERSGGRAARWLAPSMYSVALAHGLRGDDAAADDWRSFAGQRLAGAQTRAVHFQVGAMATFVDARLALHCGEAARARELIGTVPTGPDAWHQVRHWYFDAYPWALAADVAAALRTSDAEERLAAAEPAARENPWAAACLARARARMTGEPADVDAAITAWEDLDARYERACTLLLAPDRRDEAHAEFAALRIAAPAL